MLWTSILNRIGASCSGSVDGSDSKLCGLYWGAALMTAATVLADSKGQRSGGASRWGGLLRSHHSNASKIQTLILIETCILCKPEGWVGKVGERGGRLGGPGEEKDLEEKTGQGRGWGSKGEGERKGYGKEKDGRGERVGGGRGVGGEGGWEEEGVQDRKQWGEDGI